MKPITEGQLSAALDKHHLTRIEVSIRPANGRKLAVHAAAFPATWHPLVAKRRDDAFAAHGGDMTLAEATKITGQAMDSVAGFAAATLDDALRGLLSVLK